MATKPTYEELEQRVKELEKQVILHRQMGEVLMSEAEESNRSNMPMENPNSVEGKYSIKDCIDIEDLRKILETFSQATGFTTGLVEYPSQEILIATGWQDVCTKFHRAFPESAKYCKKSNVYLTAQLKELKELSIRPCENGLVDGATPIVIKGMHLASLFTGQVLFEKPDMEWFKKKAEVYGYDLDAYLEALNKVPVVSEDQFKNALSFLNKLSVMIAETGLNNLELREKSNKLEEEIAERKRVEEALKEGEEKYRLITENTADLISVLNMNLQFTYVSPASIHLRGYTVEEAMEQTLDQVLTPESLQLGLNVFQKEMELEASGTADPDRKIILELEEYKKDGSTIWMEVSLSFLRDKARKPVGILIVSRDITGRRLAEKVIRENEKRYRNLFENALVGMWISKVEDGKFVASNKKNAEIVGIESVEDLVNNYKTSEFYSPKRRAELLELLNKNGKVSDFEAQLVLKDGTKKDVSISAQIFPEKGHIEGVIIDITDRKRAQESLQESEKRFRDFAKASGYGFAMGELSGQLVFGNPATLRIVEEEREADFIAKTFYQYYSEEDKEFLIADILPTVMKKGQWKGELPLLTAKGNLKPTEQSIFSISDKHGNPRMVGNIITDITESKRVQDALRESEEKYRLLADNVTDNIWILDLATLSFSYVSPSVVGITGYTSEEATGLQLHNTLTPASMKLATKILSEELLQESQNGDPSRSRTLQLEQYRKDRSTVWTEVSMRFIRDTEGRPSSILGVSRDITERKWAEEALLESESSLQSVFEAVPVGICFMKDRVYKRANRNWCDSFGYPEEVLIGKTTEFLYESREEYERVGKKLYGHLLEYGTASVHTRLKRSDGEIRDVVLIAKLIDSHDVGAGTVVVVHDITDRNRAEKEKRRLEDQLQQARKMEAIGTLAGGIAHDFNNLLMAIQGRTSIMLMDKDSSDPNFEYLKAIERYIGSAVDLTRQLLGFARGGKFEVKPTDLNKLIKKENRMFVRTKKEISIHEKYEDNLWIVEIDRGQIRQVLLNLYVNAWQAMPGGGDLYLETENVSLEDNDVKVFSVEPGKYVKISITDTGVGMDKATRERIFDPFFTTKEMIRGTGLGLASAYGIIKNHGGFINVYSEKDEGARFDVYLPASESVVIEKKKPTGDTLKGFGTVLFVDDEEMITEIAQDLLELLGYRTLIARSGKEAIEIYEENKGQVDIVILDMIMPDMSGSETYDKMKEIDPKIKVLLSSGYSINGQATTILDRGCNGFIQKPFKMKELSQKLREILEDKSEYVNGNETPIPIN